MIVRGSDKYFRAPFLDENEIEKVVKDYAEYLFGSSILFLPKSKITTLGGAGTISNHDPAAGYACIMEARLVEQVELGAAKRPFLAFGDTVRIEMFDRHGATIFGAIEQKVERYTR